MKHHVHKVVKHTKIWSGYLFILLGILLAFSVVGDALFGHLELHKHIWMEVTLLLLIALVAERLVQRWKQPFVMVLVLLGVLISPYTIQGLWPAVCEFGAPIATTCGLEISPDSPPTLIFDQEQAEASHGAAGHGDEKDDHSAAMSTSEKHKEDGHTDGSEEGGAPKEPYSEVIKTFANLGALILLFRIGIHSKLDLVFNVQNLLVAIGGVILPFVVGYLYASMTGGSFAYALFVGAAMTATSVGITVAVLEEMKLVSKKFSQIILGAAVIDDILAMMVLGMITKIPSELTAGAIMDALPGLGVSVAFVISGIVIGKRIVNKMFDYNEEELSKFTLAGFLALMFFYSFAAEALGLSAIVGAFIAGLVIEYSPMEKRLNRALFPLDVLFTPVFFISLGMMIDVWAIPGALMPIAILTVLAILTKLIGCGIPALKAGINFKEAMLVGYGMVPRGEIAFIIAIFGLTAVDAAGNAILNAEQYTVIASMAFLTTVVVPIGLKQIVNMKGELSEA